MNFEYWKQMGEQRALADKQVVNGFLSDFKGRTAYVRATWCKYADRPGRIDGAIIGDHGLEVLVMIYRHGSTETLNTDGHTRSYWPINAIEIAA